MSLILEALKKLDREKQSPERGFLVVAATSWPARTRKPLLALAAGAVIVAAVGAAMVAVRRPRGPVAPSSALPASAAPATATAVAGQSPVASPTPIAPLFLPAPAPANTSPPRPAPAPAATPAAAVASAPAAAAPATPPPLVLQAISSRDGKPIALVSDRLVREGDAFDGVKIIRIGDAEVEVEWKGQRSILRF